MKNKGKTMNLTKETEKTYNTQLTNLLDGIADKYDIAPERVEKFRNGLGIIKGRKFDKVVKTLGTQRCVWGFVAKTDGVLKGIPYFKGDVFKAAGWKAPAKHVRGSIFSTENNWYSWTGPNYL